MALQDDALEACALFDSNLFVDEKGQPIYPDSYAGRYIDDNGHLIIQIASSDFTPYEYLRKIYPIVEFNQVKYSKNDLDNILSDYWDTYGYNDENVFSAYVDIKLNEVVIEVDEGYSRLEPQSNNALPITFKEGSAQIATAAKTVHSGDKVVNKKSDSIFDEKINFSVGIGAKYKGKNAMVACGHGMEVGDKIYSGLTHIGTVSNVSFSDNCFGDFSIITMEGNHTADGQSKDGTTTFVNHGVINNMDVGTIVMNYTENSGFALAEITQGSVVSKVIAEEGSYTEEAKYVSIKGQARAKIISGEVIYGDSGGGVFHKFRDGRYYFMGVISSKNKYTNEMDFTPPLWITFECSVDCV